MGMLGNYQQTTELTNKDAGSCRWCFAIRGGSEYFIKEFLSPKYPTEDSVSSSDRIQEKKAECESFEKKMIRVYQSINNCSDGNAVRISEFFRVGAKYYIAMPKINSTSMEIREISRLADPLKRRICAVISHSLAGLHSVHFVHSDVKHSNILFTHSRARLLTPKLTDYDAGFFEDNPPTCAEEIIGDINYFSPEAWLAMNEGPINLTCKLDVFALGVLFHQYFSGELPGFDTEKYCCAGQALAEGGRLNVSWNMPMDIRHLLLQMLDTSPNNRPTSQEVYERILKGDEPNPDLKPQPEPEPMPDPGYDVFVPDPPTEPGWYTPVL